MSEKELQKLTVTIGGRSFPLRVNSDEVETFHTIVSEINSKVQEMQLTYSNRDVRDCLSMVLLTYAVDLHKNQNSEKEEIQPELTRLDQLLDQYIQSV